MKYDRFIPMVSHNVHTQQYITYTQNLTYVLNQNVNMAKLARIARKLMLQLQQHKWNTIKILLKRLTINAPYGSNSVTILDFFISRLKTWPLSRGYFGSWGHALVAVAVVERFKQQQRFLFPFSLDKLHYTLFTVLTVLREIGAGSSNNQKG